MKKILFFALVVLMATGCKQKNTPSEPTVSITGDKSAPSWVAVDDYDKLKSMTMTVQVDLSLNYPEQVNAYLQRTGAIDIVQDGDMMAAFSGEQCLAVATPDELGVFFLYVTPSNTEDVRSVEIRYYSSALKNIFVSDEKYAFNNEIDLGTYDNPFIPQFILLDKK